VRVNEEVIWIDREAKTVQVSHVLDGTTTTERYDVLILTAGAISGPLLPCGGVPVRTLRTVDDVDAITSVLDDLGPTRAWSSERDSSTSKPSRTLSAVEFSELSRGTSTWYRHLAAPLTGPFSILRITRS